MSTELYVIKSQDKDKRIFIGSFAGANGVGQCLQLTQGSVTDIKTIQMTEIQVRRTIATMQEWLDR